MAYQVVVKVIVVVSAVAVAANVPVCIMRKLREIAAANKVVLAAGTSCGIGQRHSRSSCWRCESDASHQAAAAQWW